MKNVEPVKDGELFIDGNALTLTIKGGNAGICQARDRKKKEERAKKKPHLNRQKARLSSK